ncbi:MAG: glycosyltransferase [Xanthomonadaceae bacterium]|nr:glycosyltransferase [Xanthomonadaceae bacterium]MDE3072508.1 glycosyltransferase [Pseudomonadota bacterium]
MRVLLWGTYDTGKPRTRILRDGMRAAGIDVQEIHADVWRGVEDKSQVTGPGSRLRLALRWVAAYPRLLWRLARAPKADLLLVGYPGVVDACLASLMGRLRGIPVAWDVFISLYDTLVEDRNMLRPGSLAARCLRGFERRALRCVDLAFMDTAAHARRIESLFGLPAQSCGAVWVGAETAHFGPAGAAPPRAGDAPMQVLFYGQFIPLHGIPTIVEAARLLRDAPIEWTLIGRGQEAEKIRAMLASAPLPKLRWVAWVDYAKLRDWIAQADLCLGIFGASRKAASVIPNKVFQIVAAGRPLVTRDSPAIRELLLPAPGCVYLVPDADPGALADAVREHFDAGRWRQGVRCHAATLDAIGPKAVGEQFLQLVRQCLFRDGA